MSAEPLSPNASQPSPFSDSVYFEARYASWLGVVCLILGLINLGLALWVILLSGQFTGTLFTGILLTVIGALYLSRPYFVVADNRITLYNLMGSAVKRYVYPSAAALRLEGSTIYIDSAGAAEASKPRKIKLTKWMTRPADWERLELMITGASHQSAESPAP